MTGVIVEIHGSDLPGRRCGPSPEGAWYENIHVGIKRRTEAIDLVPGDALSARWEFEITLRSVGGTVDFGGPFIHGRRGERSLGLCWGTVANDGSFDLFRGLKLRLFDVHPSVLRVALNTGARLIGSLGLTDHNGWPRCASVRPPEVIWSTAAPSQPE